MSTNLIENLIGSVRKLSARACSTWKDGQMALRWTCSTAMDAAPRRSIRGHKGIAKLMQALGDHDHKLELESQREAARATSEPPK